jgi:protein tyrosine/serine phosphatase
MRIDRNYFRVLAVAVACALSAAASSSAQTQQSATLSTIRIENFGPVNDYFYRGAQPSRSDLADLASLGIKTVIDLQREGEDYEQQAVQSLGMKFYRIGMSARSKPTREQVDQFLKIVNDPTNQPVFVHCRGGRHRTGVMTAVYRMRQENWDASRAYTEMKKYEFEKGFGHGALKSYVYEYYAGVIQASGAEGQNGARATASSH